MREGTVPAGDAPVMRFATTPATGAHNRHQVGTAWGRASREPARAGCFPSEGQPR
ncbi:hypothetical protein [Meiothermus sp.]|uniref:hypothetical protein n=1 Tax=Meiothermus sp. TaxID=1955249 RepID=UPI00298EF349|nr:hypothetical protein [Meiothermus sp.]